MFLRDLPFHIQRELPPSVFYVSDRTGEHFSCFQSAADSAAVTDTLPTSPYLCVHSPVNTLLQVQENAGIILMVMAALHSVGWQLKLSLEQCVAYSLFPSLFSLNNRARASFRHEPISLLARRLLQCTEGLFKDRPLLGAERQRHRGHITGLGNWSGAGAGWQAGGGRKASGSTGRGGVGSGSALLMAARG